MIRALYSFIFLALFCQPLMAQKDFVLYNTEGLFQRHYVNPAFTPDTKVQIGVPGITSLYGGVAHSGFTLADLIQVRPDDSLTLNVDNMISKLKDNNFVTSDFQIDLLNVGFYVGEKNYFSFSVSQRVHSRFIYPRDLAVLVWEGNGKSLLGERASFDGIGFDFNAYREFAVGYTRVINDKLTLGGRFKYLQGHFNIHTRTSVFGLHTDETTYDLTIDGQGEINTAGFLQLMNDDLEINDLLFGTSNHGFAVDFGATYQLNDKISLSASLLDLGYIRWKDYTRSFVLEEFEYTFEGVDLQDFIDDSGSSTDQVVDSLENLFEGGEHDDAYNAPLYTRFFIGGNYELNEKFTAGALLYNEVLKGHFRSALTLSMNVRLKHWLSATGTYTMFNRSYTNLGLGFVLRGGPVQFYLMTDNVFGVIIPDHMRNWHVRTGINVVIGKREKADQSSLN